MIKGDVEDVLNAAFSGGKLMKNVEISTFKEGMENERI